MAHDDIKEYFYAQPHQQRARFFPLCVYWWPLYWLHSRYFDTSEQEPNRCINDCCSPLRGSPEKNKTKAQHQCYCSTSQTACRATSPFCMWISCWWCLSRSHRRLTAGPDPQVRASGTYAMAPYGRMLCAMLASWRCPRVNGQTLVNPAHSPPSLGTERLRLPWRRVACGLLRGNEEKGSGHKWLKVTSQIEVSGTSWQGIWLLM